LFLVFKVSLAVQYSQSKILLTISSFKVFLNQHESGGAKSGLQEGCFDKFVLEALPNNFDVPNYLEAVISLCPLLDF
jgi:hypothetical protein